MNIRTALVLLLVLASVSAHATCTLIDSRVQNSAASSATTVLSGDFTAVQAGDTLIGVIGNGEGGTTTIGVSDGTSSFSEAATPTAYAGANGQIGLYYLLSSVATGGVTYTITYGAARTYRSVAMFQFRCTDTVSFGSIASAAATSAAPSSGNLVVPTGDVLAIGGVFTFSGANLSAVSPQINGVAADGFINADYTLGFYRAISTGFTGAATATLGGSDQWGALLGYFTVGEVSGPTGSLLLRRRRG